MVGDETEAGSGQERDEPVERYEEDEDLEDGPILDEHKGLKFLFDVMTFAALAAMIAVLLGHVGIGISLSLPVLTYILAGTVVLLALQSMLYLKIPWWRYREGLIQHRSKADLVLGTISVLTLFMVVGMVIVEILALLVFLGVWQDVGEAGVRFAGNFVLIQTVVLLVYLLILVARQQYDSNYQPGPSLKLAADILSPIAFLFILIGALLASEIPQTYGFLWVIESHQAVYVVTLGVLLEFMAVSWRLRLPSVASQMRNAIETSKKADTQMREILQKKAMRTYIGALVFVVITMIFAGLLATGEFAFTSQRLGLAMYIFYGGFAVIIATLVGLRFYQASLLKKKDKAQTRDELLESLVAQRKRSTDETFRIMVYGVGAFFSLIFLAVMFLTATERLPFQSHFATDFFLLALLAGAGPFGYFHNHEFKRIEAIDEKFPDLLRDIAESARAGMTLPRALVTAAHGTYGALTPEIQKMAAQVEWGVAFSDALERFAQRTNTPLINRTVSLVVEAQRAGGNVVDILTAASDDAREIKQIVGERNEQMKMYSVVIYIAFFVFVAVVLILSSQFIPAFKSAVSSTGGGGESVGGLSIEDFDVEDFNTVFFHAAIVQSIGGGLVGGVLTRGSAVAGFNAIGVMLVISWISFRPLLGVLTGG